MCLFFGWEKKRDNMKIKQWYKNMDAAFFLVVCIVMVVAIGVVGILLTWRSVSDLKKAIWDNMESVATTAATLVDGEEVKLITEADAPTLDEETGSRIANGSERYTKIEQILNKIKHSQKDMYIPYIYITRLEDGHQVFIVDPDIDAPAEYGEEVVYTPSQPLAWAGEAAVDDEPYTDEWGTYYTAWSPIKDAAGNVVGLVGVDFESSRITDGLRYSMIMIIGSTAILLVFSIFFFVLYSVRVRKRSQKLSDEIAGLSNNLKTVFDEIEGIEQTESSEEEAEAPSDPDFLNYVHNKTLDMTKRLREHTAYMEQQANVDFMTHTGNTRAYSAEKNARQAEIDGGTADFAVAIFDVNWLKKVNDSLGHECGDILIKSAAEAIKHTFMADPIYRIGGDEFAVIIPGATAASMNLQFQMLDLEIDKINQTLEAPMKLAIARGYSIYDKTVDKAYRDVFVRADKDMYANKEAYHKQFEAEPDEA